MLPVVELVLWTIILAVLLLSISALESFRDLLRPLIEDLLELIDHLIVESSVVVDVLGFLLPFTVVLLKVDVVLKGLQGLSELVSELVEDSGELLLVLVVAETPLIMSINQWFVDLVDNGVEGSNGMLRDLTEQDIIVIGTLLVDWSVIGSVSKEVNTFTLELNLLTISDLELLVASGLYNLAGLGDLVWGLMVDENSRGTFTLKECIEESLRGAFEDFHSIVLS